MIRTLLYIRLLERQPPFYAVPLLTKLKALVPGLTSFEFDNFSDGSMRHYASELLKQSQKAAIVVAADTDQAPITGLSTVFNTLLKAKPPVLLMALQGEQPQLQKMMQALAGPAFYHNLPEASLEELLKKALS